MDHSDHKPQRWSQTPTVVTNPNNDDGVEETTVTGLRGEGKRDFCFIYEIELVHGGRTF